MSSRAGSHAGRGFRYQDAVTAWLAVGCWTQRLPYGGVTPEGRDDIELSNATGFVFVQAKSRREHLGCFPAHDAARFIKELWDRYDASIVKPERLVLVLERPVDGFPLPPNPTAPVQIHETDVIGTRLHSDSRSKTLNSITQIIVLSAPREDATNELARSLGFAEQQAWISFGALLTRVGELADRNGTLKPNAFVALAISDIQREIDVLRDAISPDHMETALREGICEAVDFLTPLEERQFYLGVDVQPGHLAAGLVVERPGACERVIKALDDRGNVLIVGPSGSGKSALMWEVARSIRHVIRWFRIRRLNVEHVPLILRLARAYRSSVYAPVGFVFDDVGRGLTDGWDALSREGAHAQGVVLLGSAREEDLFSLMERARTTEVREPGDDNLAEWMWAELCARKQTKWLGWREPWRQSRGLLLEYVYLLTQGSRLASVLRNQVADRARDTGRDAELAILRVTAAAGATGARVDVERLPAMLNRSADEISRSLRRLIDEHLIRDVGLDRIGALHQLRAKELFSLCHEYPPPTQERTIITALHCVSVDDIGTYVARTLEDSPQCTTLLVGAIAERLDNAPDATVAASALKGLGQAHIAFSVSKWLEETEVRALPRTQITSAALLGLPGVEFPEIPQLAALSAASRSFRLAVEASSDNDPRKQLFACMATHTIAHLFNRDIGVDALTTLLGATIGSSISRNLRDQIIAVYPDLLNSNLAETVELLGTARLVDPKIAEAWVDRVGQLALISRIEHEVPWVTCPGLREEVEGLVVYCDIRHVASSRQANIHDEVVKLCELMLALVPRAKLAVSKAISPDGQLAGLKDYPLASKSIPRENLPPSALPAWYKQWRTMVADRIAAPSYTDYLSRAIAILRELVPALERFLDDLLRRGKIRDEACDVLVRAHVGARELTPPRESPRTAAGVGHAERNESVTDLQDIIFNCSIDLVMRFSKLPEGANAYIGWTGDILKRIDAAVEAEPWELLTKERPPELRKLRQIVEDLRLMAGEASARNVQPLHAWHKPKAQSKTAFRIAGQEVRRSVDQRLRKTYHEIAQALGGPAPKFGLYVRAKEGEIAPWPPAEVLITVSIEAVSDWPIVIDQYAEVLRFAVGEARGMTVVPLVNGIAVDRLTVGGVQTLLPCEGAARAWLEREGIKVLDDVRVRALGNVCNPLSEISGMTQFGYGGKDRPAVECEALAAAYTDLAAAMSHLRSLLEPNQKILERIEKFVENVTSGKFSFAADMMASVRGEIQPSFVEIVKLLNELTNLDLNQHRSTSNRLI